MKALLFTLTAALFASVAQAHVCDGVYEISAPAIKVYDNRIDEGAMIDKKGGHRPMDEYEACPTEIEIKEVNVKGRGKALMYIDTAFHNASSFHDFNHRGHLATYDTTVLASDVNVEYKEGSRMILKGALSLLGGWMSHEVKDLFISHRFTKNQISCMENRLSVLKTYRDVFNNEKYACSYHRK